MIGTALDANSRWAAVTALGRPRRGFGFDVKAGNLHSRKACAAMAASRIELSGRVKPREAAQNDATRREEFWNEHLSAAMALPGRPQSALQVVAAAKEVSHPDS